MRRRGLSLAEVMVAIMFLSVALTALVSVQIYTLRAQPKEKARHVATSLAQSEMSRARQTLVDDFNAPVGYPRTALPERPEFEAAVQAGPGPPPYENDLTRVEVSIYWTDAQGDQRFDGWTYVSRPR